MAGYTPRWYARLKTVTHPSTNRPRVWRSGSNSRPLSRKSDALIDYRCDVVGRVQLLRRPAGQMSSPATTESVQIATGSVMGGTTAEMGPMRHTAQVSRQNL